MGVFMNIFDKIDRVITTAHSILFVPYVIISNYGKSIYLTLKF